jgi:hypothetical protein
VAAFDHVDRATRSPLPSSRSPTPQLLAPPLVDLRFRTLIGEEAWARLPEPVRRRFSKCLAPEEAIVYRGQVVETELSRCGRILSFLTRAIGAPLPLTNGGRGPALVIVTEDERLGGQSWTRIYTRAGRRPQTVHSAKRFRGPSGLEEYVGYGIGMALRVAVEDSALMFRSDHYFLTVGAWRLRLPQLLVPGEMCITHRDEGQGSFSFSLRLTHRRLGCLVYQRAHFVDP